MVTDSMVTTLNGKQLDTSRPMFDSDDQAVQQELKIIDFAGFSYQGGQDIVAGYGKENFIAMAQMRIKELHEAFNDSELVEIDRAGEALQGFSQRAYDFVKGCADACDFTYGELYKAFAADESCFGKMIEAYRPLLGVDPKAFPARCTVGGWRNGLLWENCDNPASYTGKTTVWRSKDFLALSIGTPFFFAMAMTRSAAAVINTNAAFDDCDMTGGVPMSLLIAHMLHEDKTVKKMIAKVDDYVMNSGCSMTVVDIDQDLVCFEFNLDANRVLLPEGKRDYLAHTNHPIHLTDYIVNELGGGDEREASTTFKYTTWRLAAAENFLKYSPEQTPEALMSLARQKPVEFAACRGDDFMTSTSVVWDLAGGCAYIAPYRPSLCEFVKVSFSEA